MLREFPFVLLSDRKVRLMKRLKQQVELPIIFMKMMPCWSSIKPDGVRGAPGVSFGVIEALRGQRPQTKVSGTCTPLG